MADAQFGTVLLRGGAAPGQPVAWPSGYSGRYAHGEIEVVAPDGHVVAVTGKSYELIGVGVDVEGISALGACGAFER